jgi:hypothetical protein
MKEITKEEYYSQHPDFRGVYSSDHIHNTNYNGRRTMLDNDNGATVLLIEGEHFKISEKMNIKNNYYLFGGKGDVWSETAHIAKSGDHLTLCGKPMLSTNHVARTGVDTPQCRDCISVYVNQED